MSIEEAPDDGRLRRYLLGLSPADESERFDELSVSSDDFAARLQAVEYDLVDAYAAGELSGETLAAFQSSYAAFADGRAEISFAETLLAYQHRGTTPPAFGTSVRRDWWSLGFLPRWTLAVAATVVLAAAGYLLSENWSLRRDVDSARTARTTLEERTRTLQQQVDEQRNADAETTRELARLRASLATIEQRANSTGAAAPTVIAAFVLPPAMRGLGDLPTVTLPPGADIVRLQLPLEDARITSVTAVLRDAVSNQIVWRSTGPYAVAGSGQKRNVAIAVPAPLLKPRTYLIELTGVRANGASEALSPYSFQVLK